MRHGATPAVSQASEALSSNSLSTTDTNRSRGCPVCFSNSLGSKNSASLERSNICRGCSSAVDMRPPPPPPAAAPQHERRRQHIDQPRQHTDSFSSCHPSPCHSPPLSC